MSTAEIEPASPLLSIVTPNRNHLEGLKYCRETLPRQTFQNWEHLIIDSASTDGSVEFASAQPQTRVISEKDNSIEEAFNKGLRLARGKYITFLLGWDQLVSPTWLEKGVSFLEANPDYSMATAALDGSKGRGNNYHAYPSGQKMNYYFFVAPWTTLNETAFICHRSVLQKIFPPYDTVRDDSDIFHQFWINFFAEGYLAKIYAEDVVAGREHGESRVINQMASGIFRRKEHDFLDKKRVIRRQLMRRERTLAFKDSAGQRLAPDFQWSKFMLATLLYKTSSFTLRKVLRRKIHDFQYFYAQDLARKCVDRVM